MFKFSTAMYTVCFYPRHSVLAWLRNFFQSPALLCANNFSTHWATFTGALALCAPRTPLRRHCACCSAWLNDTPARAAPRHSTSLIKQDRQSSRSSEGKERAEGSFLLVLGESCVIAVTVGVEVDCSKAKRSARLILSAWPLCTNQFTNYTRNKKEKTNTNEKHLQTRTVNKLWR